MNSYDKRYKKERKACHIFASPKRFLCFNFQGLEKQNFFPRIDIDILVESSLNDPHTCIIPSLLPERKSIRIVNFGLSLSLYCILCKLNDKSVVMCSLTEELRKCCFFISHYQSHDYLQVVALSTSLVRYSLILVNRPYFGLTLSVYGLALDLLQPTLEHGPH